MFDIELVYKASLEEIDAHMAAHVRTNPSSPFSAAIASHLYARVNWCRIRQWSVSLAEADPAS